MAAIGSMPTYAIAPALIMAGFFMMKGVKSINFDDVSEAFPAFITIVMIPLSYSISTGLAYGLGSFVTIKLLVGQLHDIKPAMWIIAILSFLFLAQDGISRIFTA